MEKKKDGFLKPYLLDITEVAKLLDRHTQSVRYAIHTKRIIQPKRMFIAGRGKLLFDYEDFQKLKAYFYRKEDFYGKGKE